MRPRSWYAVPLLVLAVSCYKYTARPIPAPGTSESFHASKARVRLHDGRVIQMEQLYVRGDSLRTDHPLGNSPDAVALADVDQLQIGELNRRKTFWRTLLVGEVALLGAIVYMIGTDKS